MPSTDTRARTDSARRILTELNRNHGTRFRLSAEAVGGVNDTWLLDASDGGRAVLKTGSWSLDHLRRAAAAVEQLRARGYPTPEWLFTGAIDGGPTYHVQAFVPGKPGGTLNRTEAQLLIELIEGHAGLDVWPDRDWSAYVAADFANCAEELRRTVPAVVPLVERYQRLVTRLGRISLPGGDLVHGDFHSGNVLLNHGRVSAVIDIEACGSGTRVIDFAWLLRDCYVDEDGDPEVRLMIRRAGEAVAGPEALAFCASTTALDSLRWQAQHRPDAISLLLAGLHRLVADLAVECPQ